MQDTQTDSRVSDIAGRPTCGTLYGLGVGPGSPDLLTIRAVKVLQSVSVILAAASPKNDDSLALSIAAPHLPPGCETVRLDFPMTRDTTLLHQAWEQNAQKVASLLKKGMNAAFLTLGDPLIYSTFGYLMRTLRKTMPGLPIEIVPGITSYQAAAAHTQTVLCEGEENLLLLSGIADGERLELLLRQCDSAAILKTYRNIEAIRRRWTRRKGAKTASSPQGWGWKENNAGRALRRYRPSRTIFPCCSCLQKEERLTTRADVF